MADPNQVDLLLVGKTGNGKIAFGNSILRRRTYELKFSETNGTTRVQYEVSEFNGRIIKVVDSPGVGDIRLNNEGAVKLMLEAMNYAIAMNTRGYHAFILVVRFGCRFTDEDRDTITFLKKIFGQDFVKNVCILLITYGDIFEYDSKVTGISFPQWCREQHGQLQDLIKECDNRVVLFDNVTIDQEKKNKQIENLLQVVDILSFSGRRYTDDTFARAKQTRDRIMADLKKSVIPVETMTEISPILLKIEELREKAEVINKVDLLETLQVRVEPLLKSISTQDEGTGAWHDLYLNVELVKKNVIDEIAFSKRVMKERESVRRREEETRRKHEEEIKLLKEQHDKKVKQDEKVIEEQKRFQKEQERLNREKDEVMNMKINEMEENHKHTQAQYEKRYGEIGRRYRALKEANEYRIIGVFIGCVILLPALATLPCIIF